MTPTRAQYDAVLTRSQAGVRALTGDLDDTEDRNTALDWLEAFYAEAAKVAMAQALNAPEPADEAFELTKALKACHAMQNPQPEFQTATHRAPDPVLEALLDEEAAIARGDRTAHWHFGDDPYCEDCRPLNDWPPPAKGTHESDLDLIEPGNWDTWYTDDQYAAAANWSRSR